MLHSPVVGLKSRRVTASTRPEARSIVNSSMLPRPPRIGRAWQVLSNSSQSVQPFSRSASLQFRTFQLPMRKSKAARPSPSPSLGDTVGPRHHRLRLRRQPTSQVAESAADRGSDQPQGYRIANLVEPAFDPGL